MGSAAALDACLLRASSSAILSGTGSLRAQPGAESRPPQGHSESPTKVLEESVISMLSVRRDAFLSELLCHSHQVSGVWVAKTVRRNKKAITACV